MTENSSETHHYVLLPMEQRVLDKLTEAWNEFAKLPVEHPDQQEEFRHTFHDLQRQIMVRPMVRNRKPDPDRKPKHG